MAGKVLELSDLLTEDQLGCWISEQWVAWKASRASREKAWDEIRRYVYATDTTSTSNSQLPWKNKTTIPKLCQIRDNLYANYMATMFPKRKWLVWEGDSREDETLEKREAIETYMQYVVERSNFREMMGRALYDYIDYGQPFLTVGWRDDRISSEEGNKVGYVGPELVRISPLDIVFNPLAPTFEQSPKIVRSFLSLGELAKYLESETIGDDEESNQEIFDYLMKIRHSVANFEGDLSIRDGHYQMDGFNSFREYLGSHYVEVLTFYGDVFDIQNNQLLKNYIVTVIDRHKVVSKKPNPAIFGTAPIYTSGWRKRSDNLWSMGPLENLVGMQYRIDHLENMKSDVFDLITYPPLKIKGDVDEFEWAPMARIYVGDSGDVELMSPQVQALNANFEIQQLENKMEEMAGAPKEAMGFRTPGEKTAYEVQRLENSASRIYQNKISQFEEEVVEPVLNAMLELARRKMDGSTAVRVFNDDTKIVTFHDLTPADITGQGRIRPVAARHFSERAEKIQNLTNLYSGAVGADQDVRRHFSSLRIARMVEELLDLQNYELVEENIRILENAEAQTLMNTVQEQVSTATMTPSGLSPEDADEPF